ncbi:MAG: rhodanese-like domain-containing protein [Paludibacteraceae bacterium]|jgi:rhodanese-related sulfurtransferase|nr:rhodanese-like domain-containing protein [Paludibacteraceae bacterium]MDD5997587.1 rhodanese-like domain-containing protein [Bacteroidales bacterium]MBQ6561226.1 rhodanese-like domain-containing protein [Paludibacteraceae bacterium]MBQ8020646.1 rhodanese-like domain-containing protein [Paludibacteraceae bacterium]MBR6111839.1 rhodanese-like domain-containing protein [Paludibacteraceae bacterium]
MNRLKRILIALGFSSAVAANAGEFTSLSVTEFATAIKNDSVVVVDVRTPAEYKSGYIKGAQNIDMKSADFQTEAAKLDKKKKIAVYCRSGKRSKIAANALADMGYMVIELNSGMLGWQNASMPVEK